MNIVKPEVEEWRAIPDFEEYKISSWGRLRLKLSCEDAFNIKRRLDDKDRIKKARISKCWGVVCLRKDGKYHWFKVGQLVLRAFVGPPPSEKERNARHLNDNPRQNWITNLAWGTHKDNHDDGVRNGRHAKKGTKEALRYAEALKGKTRPEEVKKKISATKRAFPERQHYAREKGSDGRFVR